MIDIDASALESGGTIAVLPGWRGQRTELRVSVTCDGARGRRRYSVREWFADDYGDWYPGRKGVSGLSGSELRGLIAVLTAAASVLPMQRPRPKAVGT
jgi:hypothetical protein